ncbi:MAG: hypothetical protein GXN93_05170, partial [Candidatus Diapherotrites archaeon]|nr:hypothetical protein [Candidatus Diapherotrites archaeon]
MIAALAGVGYNVFFRGKTKDQQEKCDRMKIKLSENRGDIITALGIFDAWNKIPEKKKTSWCMENSLNGKWLRTTRENVTELLRILNKELHFTVKFNEADVEKVNEHLPSIIAACFSSNICYFSGHRRIGYYPINNVDANFPIHPSSVVSCLRHEADWIVFESILYTSHQFLINITTLSEEEARRVIEERGLAGQRQKAERKPVRRFSVPMIGPSVAKELVRRKYGTIGQMAAELRSALDGSPVAVDYGRDGRLVLFTEAHRRDTLKSFILKEAETYRNDLLLLSHEYEIIEDGDVRCLLKAGGVLQTILMPNQSRTVELFDVSEWKWEELREIFSKFGHVESLIQHRKRGNTQGPSSGKVIYSETKSAVKACKDIDSVEYGFSVRLLVPAKPEETYKVNLSWCRREPRGFAFVSFDDPYSATVVAASALNAMEINGQSVSVLINKKNTSQLYLKNVPRDASQDDLKRAIQSEYSVVVADVSLPREKPYPTSKSDLDMYKRQLRHRLPDDIRCDIHLFNPKESDWFVRGYATCSGMEDANRICESHIVICMNGHTARVQAVIQFEIKEYIPQAIFRAIQSELESVLRQLDGPDSVVKSETLNNGCFRFRVTVSGIDRLRYCTARIDAVTKPLVKVVNEPDQRRLISSPEGRYFLKKLMNRKVKVHASFDQGRSALLVYGSREAVDAAMRQIGDFFTQHKHHHLRRLSLIGEGRVVGVLRALFRKFDIDLEKLRRQCHLDSVEVDILQHELIVYGEQEALERCDAVLQEVINELSAHSQDNGKEGQKGEGAAAAAAGPTEVLEEEEEREDFCPVCFDTPSDDSYTTEYCGHIYCRDCMDGLIHHGIRSRRLPIECAAEKCGARLVIPDFYALLGQHREALQPLIAAALDSFVVEHSDKYSHCLTPDCPVVYKVTSRKHRFDCPNP